MVGSVFAVNLYGINRSEDNLPIFILHFIGKKAHFDPRSE